MNTLLYADVFFFITAIAVIFVTAFLVAVLIYVLFILSDIKHISRKAQEESELIAEDLSELRQKVKKEGAQLKHFVSFFHHLGKRRKKGARS